jgi:hypothetical protein
MTLQSAARRTPRKTSPTAEHPESLDHEANFVIEESRMVLPGIQALFGFQLIAVFNQRFIELLAYERCLHLASIVLVSISIALIMAPAAYHRQAEPGTVSRRFVLLASGLLTWAMLPLSVAIALELFLVARLISDEPAGAAVLAAVVLMLFVWLWFLFPRRARRTPIGL